MNSDNKPKGSTDQLSPMQGGQGRSPSDSQLSQMQNIVREPPLFEQDYARIHTLMQNKELTMSYFGPLEKQLAEGKKLKHVLYASEQQHGFAPDVQRISGGLLDQGKFMGMLKEGRSFKDRSAPVDHGEYTHRLQWYAISKDIEANPQLYSTKNSSDLYRGLAERYERGQTAKYNWKSLFDENRDTGDYRMPENLTKDLKQNQSMPSLQLALQTEHQKRQELSKFGYVGVVKKGQDRNMIIDFKLSGKPKVLEEGAVDPLKGIERYLVPKDYQPPKRQPGEQPSTKEIDTKALVKGSRKL